MLKRQKSLTLPTLLAQFSFSIFALPMIDFGVIHHNIQLQSNVNIFCDAIISAGRDDSIENSGTGLLEADISH